MQQHARDTDETCRRRRRHPVEYSTAETSGAIAVAGAGKFVRLRSNVVNMRQDMLHAAFLLALPVPAMIGEAGKILNLSKNSILRAA
jgi:hypothetical protein